MWRTSTSAPFAVKAIVRRRTSSARFSGLSIDDGAASAISAGAASPSATPTPDSMRKRSSDGRISGRARHGVHRRADPARNPETGGLPRLRQQLHSGAAARRADGVFGRSLRSVLPLSTSERAKPMKSCPIPIFSYPRILMAHGGGGRLMRDLIERIFCESFGSRAADLHDSALLPWTARSSGTPRLAFTTDSYVVRPLFFPGGDIGTLAVNGTVNDLSMSGARPAFLSVGFSWRKASIWRFCGESPNRCEWRPRPPVSGL